MQTELQQAQQPALMQQAERAASGEQQLINQQQQMQQIATGYATALQPLLNNPEALVSELQRQKQLFAQQGIDTRGIDEDIIQAQTPQGLQSLAQEVTQTLMPQGQQQKSVSQIEFENKVSLVKNDPELKTPAAKAAAIDLGLEAKAGSSAAERIASDPILSKLVADAEALKESSKATSKGISQRQQGFIDTGIEAADSVNNIKRSLELLDSVKTGGFNNAALRVRQFFGVEGADEGELSGRLGTAVLAQLKPIFGAAFTAAEGDRLERISARFGANPETNKRLLKDALSIAERAARRGLKAAKNSGDDFSAEEIQAVLDGFESIGSDNTNTDQSTPSEFSGFKVVR